MTHAESTALEAGAAALGVSLQLAELGRIGSFLELLAVWNRRIHLTGEREPLAIVERHAVDCLAPLLELPAEGAVVDIGSGAGFPGIILSCVRPELPVVLIESRRRPASFLSEVIRAIPLPRTRVLERRAEEAAGDPELAGRARAVIARAIRLDVFVGLAAPFLARDGVAIAMQTPRALAEAPRLAAAHGLSVIGERCYQLPRGKQRALILFGNPQPR